MLTETLEQAGRDLEFIEKALLKVYAYEFDPERYYCCAENCGNQFSPGQNRLCDFHWAETLKALIVGSVWRDRYYEPGSFSPYLRQPQTRKAHIVAVGPATISYTSSTNKNPARIFHSTRTIFLRTFKPLGC
jgi:hypothetical protein